ncbi:subtilase-type protease inhibitor [Saccharopolyspora spinosporotrichia]
MSAWDGRKTGNDRSKALSRAVACIALAAAALAPGIASAAADASDARSTITLTVTEHQKPRSVTLDCEPAGGDHPKAAAACADLLAVDGNFEDLHAVRPERERSGCTKDNRNIRASAKGTWRGTQIAHETSVANRCVLKQQTGAVFDF